MSCAVQGERTSGPLFIRPVRLAKSGDAIEGHTHHFDHVTIVLKGTVLVVGSQACDCGVPRILFSETLTAPADLLIQKDVRHAITAVTDDVEFWCVFAHRTPAGEVSDTPTGWYEGYR